MKRTFGRFLHIALAFSLLFFMGAKGGVSSHGAVEGNTPVVAVAETFDDTQVSWFSSRDPETEQQFKWSLVGGGATLIVVGLVGAILVVRYRKKGNNTKDVQENNKRTDRIMKAKKENVNVQEPVMEAIPVNVADHPKEWVINCSKCGAALNVKNGKTAYICPVCGSLMRMRTGTRIVKDIPKVEKQARVSVTEKAAKAIMERDALVQTANNKKLGFWARRKAKKALKNAPPSVETLLAKQLRSCAYVDTDMIVVDLENDRLNVKTVQIPVNKEEK